jgi:hypothetical protein
VSWKGLLVIPVIIIYVSIEIWSVLEIFLLSRMWPMRNDVCAIPCLTARSCNPIPPKFVGAKATDLGVCLLNPIFDRSVDVISCCDLCISFCGMLVAVNPYRIPGRKIDLYPWMASSGVS